MQLSLGLDIDQFETAKNVKDFLLNDFQRFINQAGLHRYSLSSPQLDPTGVGSHNGNSQERKVIRGLTAEYPALAVVSAINNCSNSARQPYKTILRDKFLNMLPDYKISQKIQYSDSRYYDLQRYALCEFADRLPYWERRYSVKAHHLEVPKDQWQS